MTTRSLGRLAVVLAVAVLAGATATSAAELKNGGTMTVAYKNEMTSLDPAIGYDGASWNLIKAVFDGLMGYKVGTTDLVPGLAESYSVSPDGLTYTFKLRAGAKFHNGRPLTAEDARYAIDRIVDPKTKSPGQQFFASLLGFDERAKGTSDRLGGLTAIDDRTLEVKLAHPDASFLHIMAMNFSYPVPREEVEKSGADFGKHPVGTGAYKVAEWRPGQQIVLERNPDYWQQGLPHADKVNINVGIEPLTAFLQFERGEVDALGDGIPTAKFSEVLNDPKYKDQIVTGPRLRTDYLAMKTTLKPFDDKRVRQAVNHAINKTRLVQLISGRAVVANQILPPLMAGHDPDYQGYAYDPAKAKALLAEAGYANGITSELYATTTEPDPRIAQAIQQDLAAVGIKVELRTLAPAQVRAAAAKPDEAGMIWAGVIGWGADYPDASDYYTPILSCAARGAWNWAQYCRPELDDKAMKANAMADPAQDQARIALWKEVYRAVMDDAPWAPVYNDKRILLRSKRLAGPEGAFVAPVLPLIDYAQVYVTDGR
jgi:ABC-type transport system substrate-binding protein